MSVSGEGLVTPIGSDPALSAELDSAQMARALAALFTAGATLALLTMALPHSRRASDLGVLVIVGGAYVIAAGLYWWADELPSRVLPVALLCGSTLVALVAYFSGQSPSPLVFFYLWVFLYASYFLTRGRRRSRSCTWGLPMARCWLCVRPPVGSRHGGL